MNTEDQQSAGLSDQASLRFDDAPSRFKDRHTDVSFSGSSGVLFEQAMAQTRMAVCLSDPHQPDFPIVFANRAFRHLTGYSEEEIVGKNCRFLQGPDTDPEAVARIRRAIASEDVVVVELLNYRKNGTSFWNALHIGPIYDDDGKLVYLFGSQWDVSDVRAARTEELQAREMARELSHRMKNMFAVISGIVNVTGRARGIESEAAEINARIHALGRAYETTLDTASSGQIDIGSSIRSVMEPYEDDAGRLTLTGDKVPMPFSIVSVVGLILHELAANAGRHGAWSVDAGGVALKWQTIDDGAALELIWTESGGPTPDREAIVEGTGSRIVDRLVRTAGGRITRNWNESGLTVVIVLPTGRAQ